MTSRNNFKSSAAINENRLRYIAVRAAHSAASMLFTSRIVIGHRLA